MPPCVQFKIENGNLVVTLLPEGREEIDSAIADGKNIDADDFLHDLFEHPLCNGWEWISPEEISALTDSPILSNDATRDDQGKLLKIGRVYWFPNYQIESPVKTLFDTGSVTFTGVD